MGIFDISPLWSSFLMSILPSCSGRFVDTPSPVPVCLVTDVRPDSSLELRPAQGLLSEPAGAVHLERCLP